MKKFALAIVLLLSLTACGTTTVQTVVVDENGKVLETKNEFQGLVKIGDFPVDDHVDGYLYQDTTTGCKYFTYSHGISPLYDAQGNVAGCKKP